MFIISFKVNKNKLFLGLVILLIIALLTGLGYKMLTKKNQAMPDINVAAINQNESNLAVNFIESFGNKVDAKAVESEEFTLPTQFDTLYKRYNQYQMDIGLDLKPYLGKNVKRYTYKVLNYKTPKQYSGQQVYADVLISDGKVIAGDLKTNEINGFLVSLKGHTFKEITGIDESIFR